MFCFAFLKRSLLIESIRASFIITWRPILSTFLIYLTRVQEANQSNLHTHERFFFTWTNPCRQSCQGECLSKVRLTMYAFISHDSSHKIAHALFRGKKMRQSGLLIVLRWIWIALNKLKMEFYILIFKMHLKRNKWGKSRAKCLRINSPRSFFRPKFHLPN